MLRLVKRPVGVLLIAFPWVVVSLWLFTLSILTLLEATQEIHRIQFEMSWEVAVTLLVAVEGCLLGLGIGAFAIAMGLWRLEERGRFAAKMMAAVWVSFWFVFLILSYDEPLVFSIFGSVVAFNVWSFWYLSRPSVKSAFAPAITPLNLEAPSSSSPTS